MNVNQDSYMYASHSVEQTMALGAAVARLVRSGDMVALIGELGAGKTQFVRGMAKTMGINPTRVSSPTFVFLQEYQPMEGDGPVLAHVDAYRLNGTDDLASIGWEGHAEELRDGAVLVVEWADRITGALCEDRLEITLIHNGDGRSVTLRAYGNWCDRMPKLCTAMETVTKTQGGV